MGHTQFSLPVHTRREGKTERATKEKKCDYWNEDLINWAFYKIRQVSFVDFRQFWSNIEGRMGLPRSTLDQILFLLFLWHVNETLYLSDFTMGPCLSKSTLSDEDLNYLLERTHFTKAQIKKWHKGFMVSSPFSLLLAID